MIPQIAPVTWFRFREHAERLQRALQLAGIESTIRNADDPPPGWKTREVEGFDLWVSREDMDQAEEISHRTRSSAHGPMMLCEKCQSAQATVHVTWHEGEQRTTQHFCKSCHSAESGQA